jgi:hypothetical protein
MTAWKYLFVSGLCISVVMYLFTKKVINVYISLVSKIYKTSLINTYFGLDSREQKPRIYVLSIMNYDETRAGPNHVFQARITAMATLFVLLFIGARLYLITKLNCLETQRMRWVRPKNYRAATATIIIIYCPLVTRPGFARCNADTKVLLFILRMLYTYKTPSWITLPI